MDDKRGKSQPDITLYNYKNKVLLIFDVAIVKMKNLELTYTAKKSKYE